MSWRLEIEKQKRFNFGRNWINYSNTLNQSQIKKAEDSLKEVFDVKNFNEKDFIDIGSGSGIFSLAAVNLGAKVLSFDYDEDSVKSTKFLKSLYHKDNVKWRIESGSVLDEKYLESLGKFDYVYSWGVLHHTGDLKKALVNASQMVKESNSEVVIAIYNDQGIKSKIWKIIKKIYCLGGFFSFILRFIFIPYFFLKYIFIGIIKYKDPTTPFKYYKKKRGMHIYFDWIDWLGGYPFEVATPEMIFNVFHSRGFTLEKLTCTIRSGCNEYRFKKGSI